MARHLRANNIPAENLSLVPRIHIPQFTMTCHSSSSSRESLALPGIQEHCPQIHKSKHTTKNEKTFLKKKKLEGHTFLFYCFFFFLSSSKDLVLARQEYRLSPSAPQSPTQLYSASTLTVQGTLRPHPNVWNFTLLLFNE